MNQIEQEEAWPPPPQIAPPPGATQSRPLTRGYAVGFVCIIVYTLTALSLTAINPPLLRRIICGVIGLGLSLGGFLLSLRDISSSTASGNQDGKVVGGLGLFLNALTLALTFFFVLYL